MKNFCEAKERNDQCVKRAGMRLVLSRAEDALTHPDALELGAGWPHPLPAGHVALATHVHEVPPDSGVFFHFFLDLRAPTTHRMKQALHLRTKTITRLSYATLLRYSFKILDKQLLPSQEHWGQPRHTQEGCTHSMLIA